MMAGTGEPRPVEIIGGGLAGLALGIGLRRAGVPATIFEAGDYPRHRVCGEFIAGLSPATARALGIDDVFKDALRHTEVRWFSRDRPVCRLRLPSPAIGISRHALDRGLASRFLALGGRLATGRRVADIVPAAEGRVRTSGRRRSVESSWIGLKSHVRNVALSDDLEMHLGHGAYVGLAPVEDGWTNVCGLFRRHGVLRGDTPHAFAETLRARGLNALAARVAGAEFRAGSTAAVAGFVFDSQVAPRNGVVLGDCCAVIPPFTGHGMAMALIGAEIALGPLVDWAAGRTSWEATSVRVHAALRRAFRTRLRAAASLHPLLLDGRGQACLGALARARLLPLRSLYHLLH